MTGKTADEAPAIPLALAEPTVHVRSGWITGLGLASLGMWMAALTPASGHPAAAAPGHHAASQVPRAGSGLGRRRRRVGHRHPGGRGAVGPHPGARGLWRLRGRRHRWTLGMSLLAAVCLILIGTQFSVLGVAVFWVLSTPSRTASTRACRPRSPITCRCAKRATVAGWVGMPQALGLVVGTVLVVDVFTIDTRAGLRSGYIVLAS